MHKVSEIQLLNICVQEQAMLRTLRAKTSMYEMFSSKKNIKMTMRALQENSQNI